MASTDKFKRALEIIQPESSCRVECEHDLTQSFRRVENAAEIDKSLVTPRKRRELLQKLARTLQVAIDLATQARPWDSRVKDPKSYRKQIERAPKDVRKGARKFFCILMANSTQYFVNKLPRMHISIVHGIKLFPKIIRDIGILRSQIKIEAWHQILVHKHMSKVVRF